MIVSKETFAAFVYNQSPEMTEKVNLHVIVLLLGTLRNLSTASGGTNMLHGLFCFSPVSNFCNIFRVISSSNL